MRRFFCLLIFCMSFIFCRAQIDSVDILGINCYNNTGHINLSLQNNALSQWYWWHKSSEQWLPADTLSFVTINSTSDSLQVTNCGKYKLDFWYQLSGNFINVIDSFFVPCPVTIVRIDSLSSSILCHNDSNASIHSFSWGGDKFDPDSSIIINDTLSGDEYYSISWYQASDSSGLNSIQLQDTTPILSNISSSWYQAIVLDAIGCTDTLDYFYIDNPEKIKINNLTLTDVNCISDSTGSIQLSITGGLQPYSFNWSDNLGYSSVNQNISNLYSSTYFLSISDSLDCQLDTFFLIQQPSLYDVHATLLSPILCPNDSAWLYLDSITGGNNDSLFYSWIDSESDSLYVSAGTYGIYVNDIQYGCKDTLYYTVSSEYDIELNVSVTDVVCHGDSTGSIAIDSIYGGVSPYNVQWNSPLLSNLSSGVYYVYVVDSNGCSLNDTVFVNQNTEISSNAIFYEPSCNGFSDGAISINPSGGLGGYLYSWQNGTGLVDSLFGIVSGTYIVEISDSVGCVIIDSLSLNEPNPLSISFTNYTNPVSCFGEFTSIDILIIGGTGPFTSIWSNGDSGFQSILSAGTYTCQVIDANNCSTENTITINQPDPFYISNTTFTNPDCDEGASATIYTNGGTSPVSYFWSNGDTSATANNITTNTCWVLVVDSCGNKDSAFFSFTQYELITALYYDNISHTANIEIDYSTSTGPFVFSWQDLLGNIVSTTDTASNLCQGIYYVSTTDQATGCIHIDTLNATYDLPNGVIDLTTITVLPNDDLWGAEPYTFLWDDGTIGAHADLCPGDHWIEVTDVNGCLIREDFNIEAFTLILDPAEALVECDIENLNVELDITVSGGISPYTYLWSNGSTENPLIDALLPGIYTVTITDNNNCIIDTAFTIRTISSDCIPNVFTPNGDDVNDVWNLEDAFLFPESEIKIYNRFGREIFSSIGYNIPWDGKNKNGKDVLAGAYFYHIKLNDGYDIIKGVVSVVR